MRDSVQHLSRWSGRLSALVMIIALWLGWSWQTWSNHDGEIDKAERLTEALARANAAHVEGSLRSIQIFLQEAADQISIGARANGALRDWLSDRMTLFPEIKVILIVDAQGDVIGPPIGRPGRPFPYLATSLADRDYFQVLKKDYHRRPMVVDNPVAGKVDGQPTFPIAQAIEDRAGNFAGAVVVGIFPEQLREILEPGSVPDPGGAALFLSASATFLARVPMHEKYVGRSIANSSLFQTYLPRQATDVIRLISVADGNDKILAYRSLDRFPLLVTTWITMDQVLADWRPQMQREAAALGLGSLLAMILAWRFDRKQSQNRQLTEALARHRDSLEHDVAERTRHLAARNAELEQFAYVASHDMQEPLRIISLYSQMLGRELAGRLTTEEDGYLATIGTAARRMSALIKDVLLYSRIGHGREDGAPCPLSEAIERVMATLSPAISEAGAEISVRSPLPSVAIPAYQAESLFANLIGNAIKFHRPGIAPKIEIDAVVEDDGMVWASVADNGIGIDPPFRERIFGIFQRLHGSERYSGNGIGLALCKRIVEAQGGRIWVDSDSGPGVTFHFTLPLAGEPRHDGAAVTMPEATIS